MAAGGLNMNPTGITGSGGTMAPGPIAAPFMPGGSGNYNYGSSNNPNPTGPSMLPGGSSNQTGTGLGMDPNNWSYEGNELGKIYGRGVGSEVYGYLDSGAGYNSQLTQQAVQEQAQQMQLQANQNYGNLESGLGAAGINPNSSAASLESSNFWSQTTAAENAMTAQEYYNMWSQSMSQYTSVLENMMGSASQYKANQPSTLDYIGQGLEIAGGIALAPYTGGLSLGMTE